MSSFDYRLFIKYAEALGISAVFIIIGYFVNIEDPCFINNKINVALFVVTVLTLFFGFAGLVSFIIIFSSAFFLFYDTFPLYQILQLLMLGLILYLFHYIWETKIKEEEIKSEYLTQKLEENTNAFYTLKTSYDQLEKAYITKPFSLHDSLEKIISISTKESKTAKLEFLKLLKQFYQIRKSFFVFYKDEKLQELLYLDKESNFYENDILVKQALIKMSPVYIDLNNKTDTKYLAVIPIPESDGITLLIVEDIPFTSFNKDTLLQISVISTYFIQSIQKNKFMEFHGCRRPYLNDDFAFELCKLQNIKNIYNISSTIMILKSSDLKHMNELLSIIKKEKRAIDFIQTLTVNKNQYVILIVFPFAHKINASGFLNRLKQTMHQNPSLLKYIQSENFIYKIEDITYNRLEKLLE